MFYINIVNPGPNSKLELAEASLPQYSATQLLVRVGASGVNRADLLQRQGKYPAPPGASPILGLEMAGEIIAQGDQVRDFKPGDRIMALLNGGAYAEYCLVESSLACPIPDDWSFAFAAAIPEALTTVYGTLFDIGTLKKGQTLLVHGAGSGIASFAIQMAKLIGAEVVTTVGSDSKRTQAYALGAQKVINYQTEDFRSCLDADSIDLILDFIGADYLNKHLELLKPLGKLVQIACMKGAFAECNLALLLRKRLEIKGFVLRSQTLREKKVLWNEACQKWLPFLVNKQLKPIIDSEFRLSEAEQAHQRILSAMHFGKIILNIKEPKKKNTKRQNNGHLIKSRL